MMKQNGADDTLACITDDGDVFIVITAVNTPDIVWTFCQRMLVASTVQIVEPDFSRATAVVLTQIQTRSPSHSHRTCYGKASQALLDCRSLILLQIAI